MGGATHVEIKIKRREKAGFWGRGAKARAANEI